MENRLDHCEIGEQEPFLIGRCREYQKKFSDLTLKLLMTNRSTADDKFSRDNFTSSDRCIYEKIMQLHRAISSIYELQQAFADTGEGLVSGPKGVAHRIGLHRKSVYSHLQDLGLQADDFRQKMSVHEILARSPKLLKLIEEIKSTIAEMTLTA